MEENRFFEMKKWLPVPVVVMMLLSGLYVAFLIGGPAQGAPSLGTITVSGGNTRSFTGVDYILDGNITVTGSGSRLTFVNCNLTISQDVGMDGIFGGSDDHVYSILVQSGGYLEFKNSKITTQTDQLHPYFMMDIDANGSGSRILFDNVIMEGPGEITASSGARIDALGSVFMELEDKDDLAYDIDGDGGTEDDEDYNNDGPLFTYRSGAQGLIVNSQIRDTFSFSTSSRDGRIAGNMTLDGTGTNVTIINSFLDVDFETNRSTGTHNMLKVSNGAVAHLVGVALNVSASDPTHPAIFVEDTGSKAVYYRWIATHVLDGMDIQVEDQSVTIYRIEGNTNSRLTSSYLTSDIRNFMERTPLTWNQTGPDGWSFIPVITDVIRPSTMPNSDAYPDFRVQVIQGTETVSTHTSFNNYPKVPDQDEARYLLEAIKDGSADQTHAFSDLEGPMEFDRYVVTPSSSSYFSGSDVDLTLNSAVTLTGTSAIIDGTFYPSYYAFDGH
ncbi:MAG: hypothetical protein U9R75_10005, partial [Candidatus Thermoplasmatota archaeon]|nr:hypothetical protein [Candidatus Thermoplasmatota archaeon]